MLENIVTDYRTSKNLYELLKNVNTVFTWKNEGREVSLRAPQSINDEHVVQIPCFTSEELKTHLLKYQEDVSYSYEERVFYYIDYNVELPWNELPPIHRYPTEVIARANYLIYLMLLQLSK